MRNGSAWAKRSQDLTQIWGKINENGPGGFNKQ